MAASDYFSGRPIALKKIPDEIIMYDLIDKHHWTPDQIRNMRAKDIKALTLISSIGAKIRNKK